MSNTNVVEQEIAIPNFGNGVFSHGMLEMYQKLQKIFGFSPAVSEKIARQMGTDAGSVFKDLKAAMSFGKIKGKDLKMDIGFAAKAKGVTVKNSLFIARAIQWIEEAGNNGISFGNTEWKLRTEIQEWVDKLEMGLNESEQAES